MGFVLNYHCLESHTAAIGYNLWVHVNEKPKPLAKEELDWNMVKAPLQSLKPVLYNLILSTIAPNTLSKEPPDVLILDLHGHLESLKLKPV